MKGNIFREDSHKHSDTSWWERGKKKGCVAKGRPERSGNQTIWFDRGQVRVTRHNFLPWDLIKPKIK